MYGSIFIFPSFEKCKIAVRLNFAVPVPLTVKEYRKIQFDEAKVDESSISNLLMLIRKYKKGLEQEIFIRQENI